MKVILNLFFIILIFIFPQAHGQTKITVSAIVKDNTDKLPLAFVNAILKTENEKTFVNGTITDENGRFTIGNLVSGTYLLELSMVGYKTKSEKVFLGSFH